MIASGENPSDPWPDRSSWIALYAFKQRCRWHPYSLGKPYRLSPALLESVDCWPLVSNSIQIFGGMPIPVASPVE
jgi:hypothetical protein